MNKFRWPFFVAALLVSAGIVAIELSMSGLMAMALGFFGAGGAKTPGLAIAYMALLDGALFFTLLLIGVSMLWGAAFHAKAQGIITLIYSILTIIAGIPMIFIALGKMILMVALLLAIPFGTLVYLAKWGSFPRGDAKATLAILMSMKLACGVLLILSHQLFLKNLGLIIQVALCMVGGIVISFLHNMVPGIVVSITDAIAAIIVVIIAIIWAIVLLIGSLVSIVKAIKSLA